MARQVAQLAKRLVLAEWRVLQLALFVWRVPPADEGVAAFTYHRHGMNEFLLWALLPAALIEIVAIHLLLRCRPDAQPRNN